MTLLLNGKEGGGVFDPVGGMVQRSGMAGDSRVAIVRRLAGAT
jgi:hypothetical protein